MPIYEYVCENCKGELEVIQKVSDNPLTDCPSCQAHSLKKKTSMAAFHLKGGGWFKDGYENGSSHAVGSEHGTKKDNTPSSPDDTKAGSAVVNTTEPKSSSPAADSTPKSKAS
jgi:putative FmdB family regulatory protein